MSDRAAKIAEIERLRKIEEVETLRAAQTQPPKALEPTTLEKVGSAAKGIGKGVVDFFAKGSLAEQAPVVGPLGRAAGEGFRAVVEGGLSDKETIGQAWDRIRTSNKAQDQKFAEEHPVVDTAQKLVGGVGGALAVPMLGAGVAGPLGSAARVVGATGTSIADTALRTGSLDEARRAATVTGGIQTGIEAVPYIGKAAGPLATTVQRALTKAGDKATDIAGMRATKAALGNNAKAWEQMGKRAGQVGKDALDEGVVAFGDSAKKIAGKASEASKESWARVEGVFKAADDAGVKVDVGEIVDDIVVAAQKLDPLGKNRSVVESLIKEAEDIQRVGPMSLAKAQELKGAFRYKMTDPRTHALGQDGNNIINQAFAKAIKSTVKSSNLPGADDFVTAYDKSGAFGELARGAAKTNQQLTKNRSPFSLTDYIAGGTGGAVGALLTGDPKDATLAGFAVAAANSLARNRGNAALASSMRNLGTVLRETPNKIGAAYQVLEKAAQTSPAAFATAHEILLQSDPAYRKAVKPDLPAPSMPNGMPIAPENAIDRRRKRLAE